MFTSKRTERLHIQDIFYYIASLPDTLRMQRMRRAQNLHQFDSKSAFISFSLMLFTTLPVLVVVNIPLKLSMAIWFSGPWVLHLFRRMRKNEYSWHFFRVYPIFLVALGILPALVYLFYIGTILGAPFYYVIFSAVLSTCIFRRLHIFIQIYLLLLPLVAICGFAVRETRAWLALTSALMAIFAHFLCRGKSLRNIFIMNGVLLPFMAVYGSMIYMFALHFSPGIYDPIQIINDQEASHIEELERAVIQEKGFVALYGLYEGCHEQNLFLTNNGGRPGIWSLNRTSQKIYAYSDLNGSGDHIVFDCENNSTYVFETNGGRILRYSDLANREPIAVVGVDKMPTKSFFKSVNPYIFYRNDGDPSIHIFRRKDGSDVPILNPRIGMVEDLSPAVGNTFYTGESGQIRKYEIDEYTRRINVLETINLDVGALHTLMVDGLRAIHSVYDPSSHSLYATIFSTGRVFRYDEDSKGVVELARLDPGLREIAYAKKRDYIIVGNYINGNVYVLAAHSGEIRFEEKLGSRIRGISVSRDGDRAYIVSPRGIIEIHLDRI